MSPRFRPLLIALMASAMSVPAVAYAAKAAHPKAPVKPALTISPETLDPSVAQTQEVDPNADMVSGSEKDAPQSLFDAMRWAYEHNPTIRAAREGLMATEERLPQAQAGFKPTAVAGADIAKTWIDSKPSATADGSTAKDISLSVSEPLYRGGRTTADIESAKNAIMAQRAFLNQTEESVLLQVVTAYMNVLRDQSLLNLAENNQDVISKQLDASNARFNVGDVTRTDVAQSKARLAEAESGRIAALGNLRSSLAVYHQVIGIPAGRLSFPKMKIRIPATLDESVNLAQDYNPAVVAAQFLQNSAKKDVDSIFGELLPDVALVGSVGHTIDPSPGLLDHETVSSIGISATIPLYEAGSVRSRVRQAKSLAHQKVIQVEEAQREAREETVSNWETLAAARAEIDSRKAEVDANKIAREGVHKEAELGTRTILDALNADQELLNSQSALVTSRRDEVVAKFALAAALGLMTPEMLGFPELTRDYNEHIKEISGKVFDTNTRYSIDMPDAQHAVPSAQGAEPLQTSTQNGTVNR